GPPLLVDDTVGGREQAGVDQTSEPAVPLHRQRTVEHDSRALRLAPPLWPPGPKPVAAGAVQPIDCSRSDDGLEGRGRGAGLPSANGGPTVIPSECREAGEDQTGQAGREAGTPIEPHPARGQTDR